VDPLAIGAFLVAIAALVFTAINTRRGAQQSYVQELESKLTGLREDLDACSEARKQNRQELDANQRELTRLQRDLTMAWQEIWLLKRKEPYTIEEFKALLGRLDVPPTGP